MKASIISLGCPRNQIDSEKFLKLLQDKGHRIVQPHQAETLIINTCGFIQEAKKESIEVINQALELKKKNKLKKVIVMGCLVKRYSKELKKYLKGVDAYLDIININTPQRIPLETKHLAYLKISEGCSNLCSYCAIPLIRGRLKSRLPQSILDEVEFLDKNKVRELNLVAQDITSWAKDLKTDKDIAWLIKEILKKTKNIKWIRLLYTHPRFVTKELASLMAQEKKICNYIDMPIQHVNNRILKLMNRKIAKEQIEKKINLLRDKMPDIAIRTTVIAGFPTEKDKEFIELLEFIKKYKFENLGAFTYSQEEKTKAANFRQVPEKVKKKRLDTLMKLQQQISLELNKKLVGQIFDVIIDDVENNHSLARAYFQAHEIDTQIIIPRKLKAGTFSKVRITQSYEYDLVAETIR
ncbi:MAG: MiaB/RimO family radical SAM methylthiotransferase [Candidatus Omnitrophica bacterium]|nr:MiaB/RimO family radical SAM methylthiotransferase [Candidatus Omnitrophota bacterium]